VSSSTRKKHTSSPFILHFCVQNCSGTNNTPYTPISNGINIGVKMACDIPASAVGVVKGAVRTGAVKMACGCNVG
jgi:hypothetical protein